MAMWLPIRGLLRFARTVGLARGGRMAVVVACAFGGKSNDIVA